MTSAELLEGVQQGPRNLQLGFCFKCDTDYSHANPKLTQCNKSYETITLPSSEIKQGESSLWPSGNDGEASANQLPTKYVCSAGTFSVDWKYYKYSYCLTKVCRDIHLPGWERCDRQATTEALSKSVSISGKKENLGCCSCSCLSTSDYDNKFAGTAADHNKYDRHCPNNELSLFGIVVRKVKFQHDASSNEPVSLREVEVYDFLGTNQAFNKAATQSSTKTNYPAEKAVDGKKNEDNFSLTQYPEHGK